MVHFNSYGAYTYHRGGLGPMSWEDYCDSREGRWDDEADCDRDEEYDDEEDGDEYYD